MTTQTPPIVPARRLRVLISAYACAPGTGSEPGVGWNWALAAARNHEVWVITRPQDAGVDTRAAIGRWEQDHGPSGIHWVFHAGSPFLERLARTSRFCELLAYAAWQRRLFPLAERLHDEVRFDLTHHVTFVSHRIASPLYRLPPPFIFGPVAGSDQTPANFLGGFSTGERFRERLRTWADRLQHWSPSCRACLRTARRILVATPAKLAHLRRAFRVDSTVKQAIVLEDSAAPVTAPPPPAERLELIHAGQIQSLKGLWLALPALRLHVSRHHLSPGQGVRLRIVGDGPDKKRMRRLCTTLRLDPWVEWLEYLPQRDLFALFATSHALVFPSLRDSGGMVVIEANRQGCPALVLDQGGPALIVHNHINGVIIPRASPRETIRMMAASFDAFRRWNRQDCISESRRYQRSLMSDYLHDLYRNEASPIRGID